MATHYERLSTLDASFLTFEDRAAHMHVGSVSFLDAAPFQREGGSGLDFDRLERSMMPIISKYPRLRQKVWWPAGGPPVWIDDPKFDPSFHFRRVAVPSPASERELKTLVSRILSSSLDTRRPLWEAWILEGVGGDRFGLVWKIHHCMADGMTVRDILTSYLRFERTSEIAPAPAFVARPAPSVARLHLDEARRRFEKSREVTVRLQELWKSGTVARSLSDAAGALVQVGSNLLGDVAPTPFNGAIGPHRRFDWTSCELGALQEIRKESGAKINDVVLAAVCGAVRRFLVEKDVPVDDLPFRVMVPVSMRAQGDTSGGNRVSSLVVPLPLVETNPRRRLSKIVETTTQAKASGQSWLSDAFLQAMDWAGVQAPAPLARLLAEHVPANLVVTNIPGPQRRQFLLESELGEAFSLVPLAAGQGLGIALYSYNGVMHWGFNADRDLVPDLERFVRAVDVELAELHRAHTPIQVVAPKPRPAGGARSQRMEEAQQHAQGQAPASPAADRAPGRTSRARPRRKNARISSPEAMVSGAMAGAISAQSADS